MWLVGRFTGVEAGGLVLTIPGGCRFLVLVRLVGTRGGLSSPEMMSTREQGEWYAPPIGPAIEPEA
jgi:hypothetical protein